jgi:N-acetylglucosaminyldiphosphoundecaprenol N-acetyl-beta-D-mannosaminyltransferase
MAPPREAPQGGGGAFAGDAGPRKCAKCTRSFMGARPRRVDVLGCPLDVISLDETTAAIEAAVSEGGRLLIATLNVDFVMKAHADAHFAELLWRTDLAVADGMMLVWAAQLLGAPVRGRVNGTDLVWRCASISARMGNCRIALVGGAPDVAQRAGTRLAATYPGAQIDALNAPIPLDEDSSQRLVKQIRKLGSRIVLVALGAPRQEQWLEHHLDSSGASVGIGIGSAFDIICGDKSRAPLWMQRNGLEWLHRMLQEPSRLGRRYVIDDTPFLAYLAGAIARRRFAHIFSGKAGGVVR